MDFEITGLDTALDLQTPGTTSPAQPSRRGSGFLNLLGGLQGFLQPKPIQVPEIQDTAPISDSASPQTIAAYVVLAVFVLGSAGLLFYILKK
jgi:hypothetical protein